MIEGTYSDIRALRDNGQLEPGEEYVITDYPNYAVHVFAEEPDKMGHTGYANLYGEDVESPLLYDLDGDGYAWESQYGWVYYLSNPSKHITGYFDWYPYVTGTVMDIEIAELRDENGRIARPSISIKDSEDLSISGEIYGSLDITDSSHIIIGCMNEGITIDSSSYVTIGDNNEDITITSSNGVLIGDGNFMVTVENADGVEIGSDNEEMDVTDGNNISGSRNKFVTLSKSMNVIGSNCNSILVNAKFNDIKTCVNSSINGNFSKVEDSDCVDIDAYSVGNNFSKARIVSLEKVNNNTINTSNMSLVETGSFNEYTDVGKIRTYKDIAKSQVANQADNYGTVLNMERNNLLVAEEGAMDYIMADGAWMAKTTPGKDSTNKYYTIRINVPPELDRIATFYGGGRYTYGDEFTIYATGEGFTINGYIDNVHGIVHEGSTWSLTAAGNMVVIPIYSIS